MCPVLVCSVSGIRGETGPGLALTSLFFDAVACNILTHACSHHSSSLHPVTHETRPQLVMSAKLRTSSGCYPNIAGPLGVDAKPEDSSTKHPSKNLCSRSPSMSIEKPGVYAKVLAYMALNVDLRKLFELHPWLGESAKKVVMYPYFPIVETCHL